MLYAHTVFENTCTVQIVADQALASATGKWWLEKKTGEKITYPPPADALCVAKKCNVRVWCNVGASSGPLRALAVASVLHGMKGFAEKLHALARLARGFERMGRSHSPHPLGRKPGKAAKGAVLKILSTVRRPHWERAGKAHDNRPRPSRAGDSRLLWSACVYTLLYTVLRESGDT